MSTGWFKRILRAGMPLASLTAWCGCGSGGDSAISTRHDDSAEHAEHAHDSHTRHDQPGHADEPGDEHADDAISHTHTSPSGGRLIVLGEDEYHAELRVDRGAATAIVTLFDRTGRRPLAIDQQRITLNLLINGHPRQILLVASPLPNDPTPASSHFVGRDPVLQHELTPRGRLSLSIDGKPYTGQLAYHSDPRRTR